jgi:hypothetical protein
MPKTLLCCLVALLTVPAGVGAQTAPDSVRDAQDSIWLSGHSTTSGTWDGHGGVWVRKEDAAHFRATRIPAGQPGHWTFLRMWVTWADEVYTPPKSGPSTFQRVMQGLAGVATARAREIDRLNAQSRREDSSAPPIRSPGLPPLPGPLELPGTVGKDNTIHNGQVTGMTKQCLYTYLGSTYAHTVSSTTLCPLTWDGAQLKP